MPARLLTLILPPRSLSVGSVHYDNGLERIPLSPPLPVGNDHYIPPVGANSCLSANSMKRPVPM